MYILFDLLHALIHFRTHVASWFWPATRLWLCLLLLSPTTHAQWTAQTSNTTENLFGVWGSSASNVWAVGGGGTILRYNGSGWSAQASGTTSQLRTVWGSDANNVWAVGSGGTILKYNGSSWTAQTSGTTENLFGVWGSSASNVWAVGSQGVIVHYDGTSWTPQTISTPPANPGFNAVWGSDASNVLAVAGVGIMYKYNGSSWSAQPSGTSASLNKVWGSDADNIWTVGFTGTIRKFDGSSWTAQTSGTNSILFGLWGNDPDNIWAVGASGTIRKFDGSSWSTQTGAGTTQLWSVFSIGGSAWIVGSGGLILTTTVPVTPTITAGTVTGTVTACAGTVSPNQSFAVSGSNLTADIVTTAPTGFEISTSATTGFASSLTLTQSGGSVAGTTLYLRTTAAATTGTLTGNITLTSAGATSRAISVSAIINSSPSITITPTPGLTITSGENMTLTASGAGSYTWSTGETTPDIMLSNIISSTTISVTGTTGNCSATARAELVVDIPKPLTLTTAANTTATCLHSLVLLSVTATGGVMPFTYAWTAPSGTGFSGAANLSSVTATATTSGLKTFTVTVSSANNGPVSTSTLSLSVNASPALRIAATPGLLVPGGTSITLTASGADSYTWNTGQSTSAVTLSNVTSTSTISLTGSQNGCASTTAVTIDVDCGALNPARVASVTQTAVLGPDNCAVTLQGQGYGTSFTMSGPNGYIFSGVYRRAGNYRLNAHHVTQPGTYTFTVNTSDACGRTSTASVTYVVTGTACL